MVCELPCPSGYTARRRWWSRLAIAIVLFLSASFIAGCSLLNGSGETDPTVQTTCPSTASPTTTGTRSSTPELATIRVGGIAATSSAPLYLAQACGYFAQEGLTVKITTTSGGAKAVPLLISGGLDITLTNDVQAIDAQVTHTAERVGGVKFVVDGIAAKPGTFPVDILPTSPITSIRDLVGKTVSVSSADDIVTLALKNLLQANAIAVSAVHFVQISYADSVQALASGQVDAAVQTEPYTTRSRQTAGARMVVDPFADDGHNASMPIAAWITTGLFAQRYPTTVAAFQRAMLRAATDTGNRALVERIIATYIPHVDQNTAALMVLPAYPTSLDATRLQRVPALMARFNQLPDPTFQVNTMILPLPGQ